MNLLVIDENLPKTLDPSGEFHVVHATELGARKTDAERWDYAKRNQGAIITKDADFYERMLLYGSPPKVIWIRIGNMKRKDLELHILECWERIIRALDDYNLVEVHQNKIEGPGRPLSLRY